MDLDTPYLHTDEDLHDPLIPAAASPPALDIFDANVASCARHLAQFSLYIDAHWLDWRPRKLATALSTHAQLGVRLAGILRTCCNLDRPALPPVDVDFLIADLQLKIARLGAYIDDSWPDPLTPNGYRFLQLYGANLGRLARLYLHRRAIARLQARRLATRFPAPIAGHSAIARAIDHALDQLAAEWNIDL